MTDAKRDNNMVVTLIGVSSADGVTPVTVYVDPTTHRMLVQLAAGSGTVTSVSIVTANGISGSVATATTTPAITLTLGAITPTSVNGLTITTSTGTLTVTNGKTIAFSNTLTFTGTDSSSVAFGAGGTVAYLTTRLDQFATPNTDVAWGANKITGLKDPTAAQDAATKNYVDSVAQGLSVKPSAVVATTAALASNTYNNGASGVGATLTGVATGVLAVDGYNVALNDYVLVKNEAAGANNGLYKCTLAGAVGVAYILTRAVEMDSTLKYVGAFVFIEQGTTNISSGWVCTNSVAPTVGTTSITFTQFSGAGEVVAGTGLSKSGNTLSFDSALIGITAGKKLTVTDSITLATNAITMGGGEVITFSASNALSLLTSGTTVITFPAVTDTVAVLGTAQTFTATNTHKQINYTNNAIAASGNAATVPITSRLSTVTNNSAATLTITMTTTSAVDGQMIIVRILDASAATQTITWVNTENSTVSAPTTSNGSTTLPLTVGFMYNSATSKWRCIASA